MSGVAKDDTNPTAASEETVPAVGDAETGRTESAGSDAPASEGDMRPARRSAPHLRVVSDNEAADFLAAEPGHSPAAAGQTGVRIGAVIRAARENLGYSLEQVSKETRVHLSHLRAIEDMTPNLLGAPVYAKGYIRAYARHLGLDEMSTLERYLRECAILKDPEKQEIAPPVTGRKLPVAVPVLGFLIVALIGTGVAFFFMNGGNKPTSPAPAGGAVTSASDPQSTTAGSSETFAPVAQQLRVVAVKRGLIEVRSAAGDKYVRRYFEAGESYPVRVGYGWTVTAEDGSAFEWRLGDQSLGLLQAEGGPVYSQSVDIAAKRPLVDVPPPVVEGAVTPSASGIATSVPATASRSPAAAPAPSGPPGARLAVVPPKPRAAKPQPKPEVQTQAPPAPAETEPVAPPVTPAQDPALLAYPGQ